MPTALVGATGCGRCGHQQQPAEACGRCGSRWADAADVGLTRADLGVLAGVARAPLGRRQVALTIDVLLTLGPWAAAAYGLAALSPQTPTGRSWVAAGVLLGLVVALLQLGLLRSGRSVGRGLLGLRAVDDLTGLPVRPWRRLPGPGRRRVLVADLRRGHDPLAPRAGVIALDHGGTADQLPAPPTAPLAPPTSPPTSPPASVGIALDGGDRYEIHGALFVGRNPVDPDGAGRAVLPFPDLSRRLSRTHALLEWTGALLWVTDLASTTGTTVVTVGGDRLPLAPHVRTAVEVGTRLELGGRSLTVVRAG